MRVRQSSFEIPGIHPAIVEVRLAIGFGIFGKRAKPHSTKGYPIAVIMGSSS